MRMSSANSVVCATHISQAASTSAHNISHLGQVFVELDGSCENRVRVNLTGSCPDIIDVDQ